MNTSWTKYDAIAEAKLIAKLFGWGYAVSKPDGTWYASRHKPMLRASNIKVIECDEHGSENLA